ncbi:MAG: trypsin-like peptidase domain-containing protein [Thermodesulfobacteriota bacterium]|nr:trypsin-like peptidase domain-containing protein [Thermodesulfobacteriota bacterium]
MTQKISFVFTTIFLLTLLFPGLHLFVADSREHDLTHRGTAYAVTEDEKNNISIYREYGPGVVNITSIAVTWDFFLSAIPKEGTGSGSIIDKNGHILTNYHVVKDAKRLEVTLDDGSKLPAKLIGTDPDTDLAIIKIKADKDLLKVIPMGDSGDLKVGQKVLAIGNPFGLDKTLTTGIISSLGRQLRSEDGLVIDDVIQTDAAINPGNSGGPLLNSKGEMIGINSAIFSPTGASVGIGFAIPVNAAKLIIPELISKGYVAYPWLGVTLQTLIPEFARILDLKVERGTMIIQVVRGGPAYKAGLQGGSRRIRVGNSILIIGGDIITQIEGLDVNTTDDLLNHIKGLKPGRQIKLKIIRGSKEKTIKLILGERPRYH